MIITENTKRVVMITGGSRGIGLAVAKEYAKQGDRVVISGRNDTRSLDAFASLREITAEVSGALVDVKDKRVNGTAEMFGRIDVAISNAVVIYFSPFLEISEEQWDEVIDTHLKGTFFFLQAVARIIIDRKKRYVEV